MSSSGTYVGLRVLPESAMSLFMFCRISGILGQGVDGEKFRRNLHTTLIYSRVSDAVEADPARIHYAEFAGFDLFTGSTGKQDVLVARLFSPSVTDRHEYLMAKHGFTYDFPEFHPHVTLATSYSGDITKLPPIKFRILLGNEYTEVLDDTWSS